MAYVTYEQYSELGYSAVPQESFTRWAIMAEQTVRKYTFNRITDENITDMNRCGVCEIMDVLYDLRISQSPGQPITSFSNQHYSESYASPTETQTAANNVIMGFMSTYFTQEQLYRGIC